MKFGCGQREATEIGPLRGQFWSIPKFRGLFKESLRFYISRTGQNFKFAACFVEDAAQG